MPVMSPSLCIGAKPVVYLPPRNHFTGKFNGRCYPTRVSMQLQPRSQRKVPSVQAVGRSVLQLVERTGSGFVSRSKRSVFVCNSSVNAKCSQGQTQTLTKKPPTITQAPGKEKSPKLDDGGSGFPPRDDGGGGGGGGGGMSSSGGWFLFGFLLFMGYLKDLEGENENSH